MIPEKNLVFVIYRTKHTQGPHNNSNLITSKKITQDDLTYGPRTYSADGFYCGVDQPSKDFRCLISTFYHSYRSSILKKLVFYSS